MLKTFLICPFCKRPIVEKENIQKEIEEGTKYCTHCGNEIASALTDALAYEVEEEKSINKEWNSPTEEPEVLFALIPDNQTHTMILCSMEKGQTSIKLTEQTAKNLIAMLNCQIQEWDLITNLKREVKPMFKIFLICPFCKRPIVEKENIQKEIEEGTKYCTHCGKEIASTLAEALAQEEGKEKIKEVTNYFYIYTKKDHILIESVFGTEPGRTERLIEAGWSLNGLYSENKMQFKVEGKTTSVLDKGFICGRKKPQEGSCGID